ncbi:MAG TPA: NAD(P)-dependent oxidoreductase [Planktothrix sp.]|jgi:nucleoside-diphosphate-sugar epimerase
MKSVYLITGSSGFIGRALCHRFGDNADNQVVGFDMDGPPFPPPNTDCLFCDLTSDESVQKTMHMVRSRHGGKIKAVIHLAAYYSFSGKESHLYKDLTVDGTGRLLRELKEFEVGQFIFSSSMLAYKPNQPGELLTEASPLEPTWDYPKSKVETEELIRTHHGDIPVVILRIAGVYDDLCHSIPLANQIQRIYEKQLEGHMYSGDVNVRQAFVHLDDLVDAVEDVVKKADQLPKYAVFNIGEEDVMSYDEIQQEAAGLIHGTDWKTIEVPKPIAKTGAWVENSLLPAKDKPFIKPWMIDHAEDNYEMSIDQAKRQLGWQPKHSLRETLPKIIEGLKVDPQRFYKLNKLHKPAWLEEKRQPPHQAA